MTATAAPDVDTGDVKARALKGMVVLVARTMASQGLRVVSALALSRLLFPSDYGLFGIVAYAASLGVFLGDLGLSAALVRQPHEPTRDETFTIFWCHQALTAVIVAVVCALAPQLTEGYALGEGAVPMVWAMALGLFLSSLRVIPLMALERRLDFPAIARAELAENVAQVASTLAMAAAGLGAWALALGALVRGAVGLACIAWASPWRPRGSFRMDVLRRLLGFGLAFQLPPLVAAVVAGWVPLVVGKVLGKDAVGLVNWAWALASTPMMLSAVLNRVAFPTYCRLQDDPEGFAAYLRTSLRRLAAVLLLTLPVAVLGMPVLVPLFFGQRWVAAVPLVQWFSLECLLIVLTGLLATAQNAGGRPWERLAVVVGVGAVKWSVGTWAIHRFGMASVGPIGLVVSLVEVWVTAWRVSRLNPALRGLVLLVVEPLVSVGMLVAAAFLVVHLWIREGGLSGWAVGTAVFGGLVLVRELLPGTLSLVGEVRDILAFIRARRDARVVPASPVS